MTISRKMAFPKRSLNVRPPVSFCKFWMLLMTRNIAANYEDVVLNHPSRGLYRTTYGHVHSDEGKPDDREGKREL